MAFMAYTQLVFSRSKSDTKERLRDWLRGEAMLALASAVVTFLLSPGTISERVSLGIVIPLAGIGAWVIGLFTWNLVAAPARLHGDQESKHITEITTARDQISCLQGKLAKLTPPFELAEEDPKVFLKPLNHEFVSLGLIGFELFNDGQRVNPAQGITIHTIACIPDVRFEYVDVLRANETKRIVPTLSEYLSPACDILSELDKAWRQAWEQEDSINEVMKNEAEFPFEIKLSYCDFRPRQFETTISLRYCPVEHDSTLRASIGSNRGLTLIKVTNTSFKRLA
jgi:hypothetical protein